MNENEFDARRKSLTLSCATSMLQPAAGVTHTISAPPSDGPTLAEDALRGPRLASTSPDSFAEAMRRMRADMRECGLLLYEMAGVA